MTSISQSPNPSRHLPTPVPLLLNAAIHRIAITQARCQEDAAAYLKRREVMGNTLTQAHRALKRKLSDVVYRTLLLDDATTDSTCVEQAA